MLTITAVELELDGIAEQFERDQWFNAYRVAKTERAGAVVADIRRELESHEIAQRLRKRARKTKDQELFQQTVTALCAELIHLYLTNLETGLVVTRSKRTLAHPRRYRSLILNNNFPKVIDCLVELGIAEQDKGHVFDLDKGGRKLTTLKPGSKLVERIKANGLSFADLSVSAQGEVIVLKGEKGQWWDHARYVDYDDTDQTRELRSQVLTINAALEAADLEFLKDDPKVTRLFAERTGFKASYFDVNDRRLRRIFTRNSFESGGRLFGGFWQPLPKEIRRCAVRMNGVPIAVLDYGQMYPRLAYAQAGAVPPEGDLYNILGFENRRAGIKKLFNAMLFADKRIVRWPTGIKEHFASGTKVLTVLKAIETAHPQITFFAESGHSLQFIESTVLVSVLLRMIENGIPALPIHDAIAVPRPMAPKSMSIMRECCRDVGGCNINVAMEGEPLGLSST